MMSLPTLSVSIVTYHPDLKVLESTLESLKESLILAQVNVRILDFSVCIVCNGSAAGRQDVLRKP